MATAARQSMGRHSRLRVLTIGLKALSCSCGRLCSGPKDTSEGPTITADTWEFVHLTGEYVIVVK